MVGGGILTFLGSAIMLTAGLRFGLFMLGLKAKTSAGAIGLIAKAIRALSPIRWAALISRLAWRTFVSPLKWGAWVARLQWRGFVAVFALGFLCAASGLAQHSACLEMGKLYSPFCLVWPVAKIVLAFTDHTADMGRAVHSGYRLGESCGHARMGLPYQADGLGQISAFHRLERNRRRFQMGRLDSDRRLVRHHGRVCLAGGADLI